MTTNQIRYQELLESKRHNKASEEISRGNLDENVRHNKVNEGVSISNAVTTGVGTLGSIGTSIFGSVIKGGLLK